MTPLTEAEATRVGEVFDAHARFIEAVARRHSKAPQDVPDIVQSVGVQMCRALRGFRGEAGITTWLYRVTVNAAVDNWRLERRQLERVRDALLTTRPGDTFQAGAEAGLEQPWRRPWRRPVASATASVPETQVETIASRQRAERVRAGVDKLAPSHAALLREELSGSTVLSGSKQKSSRHRARQRLREVLRADPGFA